MIGRQWSDGLHQAVEAKHGREGVKIKEETQTLATITLQNFFKLYKKLAGMTGTAMTEANEFWKIYKLDVVAIPTNKPLHAHQSPGCHLSHRKGKVGRGRQEVERVHRYDLVRLNDGTEFDRHHQERNGRQPSICNSRKAIKSRRSRSKTSPKSNAAAGRC